MSACNSSKSRPSIFFATRPIGPPWDEASKNLVLQIAKSLKTFSGILLTHKHQETLLGKPSIVEKKIYSKNDSRNLSLRQKLSFFVSLLQSEASIYHFYFTPELYSSYIIRFIKAFKKGTFLQTFATPIQDEALIPKLAYGDAVVVQSDYSLNRLQRQGIRNVVHIPPGIDTDAFKPGIDTTSAKLKLNISSGERVILYAGNYHLGCNRELTEIILNLIRRNDNLKFILACRIALPQDVEDKERLQTVLRKEQVLDRVIFLDQTDSMAQLIEVSDIHIFPARNIYLKADIPLVLLESLAMETPVVITDIPPLNEIMKDDAGIMVRPGDTMGFTEAAQELLENPSLRAEKGKRGRQMVLKEFSLKNYLEQYNALYQKLLENG